MVQIDTLSLLKAANKAGSGTNTAPKSSATLGAFDQILSGQANTSQVTELGGNSQPSGNNLPTDALSTLQQAQSSQQLLATLSLQQHSQIDDLSFITQLQPLVDMSQTPVAVASAHYTDKKMNFSDQQLQGLAVQLGIDPAVAKLVVQGTELGSLTDADVLMVRGQQIVTQSFLQQREARAVSQIADNKMELANTINIMLSKAKALGASMTELTPPSAATSSARPAPKPLVYSKNLRWQWPVKGKVVQGYNPKDLRKGLSIQSNNGPNVRPAAPGIVVYAGDGLRGYGKLVIIKHSEILLSAYAHNEEILVKEGQSVKSGETISKLGSKKTLYFEIRKDGYPVNPSTYID